MFSLHLGHIDHPLCYLHFRVDLTIPRATRSGWSSQPSSEDSTQDGQCVLCAKKTLTLPPCGAWFIPDCE